MTLYRLLIIMMYTCATKKFVLRMFLLFMTNLEKVKEKEKFFLAFYGVVMTRNVTERRARKQRELIQSRLFAYVLRQI